MISSPDHSLQFSWQYKRTDLLRKAHILRPVVMIGREGLTTAVVAAVDEALNAHNLIKVRFQQFKHDRHAISHELAARTESELVRVLGNVAILYRPSQE